MKGKNVIAFLVSILVAIKCYIVLYSWPINDGPYQKVNRGDLEIEIDDNGYSLIIDQKIKVVNEEAVSHLKVLCHSGPENFKKSWPKKLVKLKNQLFFSLKIFF